MIDELFTNYHELESSRLLLRRITMSDLDDVFEIYSNKEVMLYFADRFPFEKSTEAETIIREYEEALTKHWSMRWGIVLKESGKLIGTCGFHALSEYDKRIEVGYDLNRNYWQKGIMTEALSLIINHAFGCSDVNRIEAMVEPPNTGSRALLEKLGFQYEGTLRKHEMCRGDFVDIQMFSLLREDRKLGGTYGIE